jgi:hypothetical protein
MLSQTIFLTQTDMFWLFFIQFYSSGSHTEHRWRCNYLVKCMHIRLPIKVSTHPLLYTIANLLNYGQVASYHIPNITSNIWMMNIMLV